MLPNTYKYHRLIRPPSSIILITLQMRKEWIQQKERTYASHLYCSSRMKYVCVAVCDVIFAPHVFYHPNVKCFCVQITPPPLYLQRPLSTRGEMLVARTSVSRIRRKVMCDRNQKSSIKPIDDDFQHTHTISPYFPSIWMRRYDAHPNNGWFVGSRHPLV